MKVIVVGCGRVGSSVALELKRAGWDVAVIDEREEALGRLGDDWTGGFFVGHGMELALLREASTWPPALSHSLRRQNVDSCWM